MYGGVATVTRALQGGVRSRQLLLRLLLPDALVLELCRTGGVGGMREEAVGRGEREERRRRRRGGGMTGGVLFKYSTLFTDVLNRFAHVTSFFILSIFFIVVVYFMEVDL